MAFSEALEREIRLRLQGNDEKQGLYRQILSCPNFDTYNRINGHIHAYEDVLQMMRTIAKRMNEGEEPVRAYRPSVN
jgi:succinate dehydrogenase flavin-adding protein (antitoxin of CptAB toxin-antitoxin module)